MRHVEVKIKRDSQTTYVVTVPEWEIPILEFIYDDGNVERLDGVVKVDREYPSAEFEFDRLTRSYGKDSETKIPFVVAVYGSGPKGIRELKRVMLEARDADSEPAAEPAPKPKRAVRAPPSASDPLLA